MLLGSPGSPLHIHQLCFLFSFLGTLCTRVGITVSQDPHAYIPTEDNLLYLVEDMVMPIKREDTFSKETPDNAWKEESGSVTVLGSPIGFEPGELDFGGQPIGVPVLRKVRIHNLNAESSIQMLSISGNTVHFHCSFFAAKVIPPLGNTTFDVVFLNRAKDESFENTLYIHTSAGSFRFKVKAVGSGDPYGLTPLTGLTLPPASVLNKSISLHNPGPEPLQVLEMITSGSKDLSLIHPEGEALPEVPQEAWIIPPFSSKVLMIAKFMPRKEKNYTAYIRLRTNATSLLYIPFEATVVQQTRNNGLFAPETLLDFGTFVLGNPSEAPPTTRDCLLYSNGPKRPLKPIRLSNDLKMSHLSSHFPPSSPHLSSIASFTFTPTVEGIFEGTLEFICPTDKSIKLIWTYRATVLNGSLAYNESTTRFHISSFLKGGSSRKFTLRNEFKVPVRLRGIRRMSRGSPFFSLTEPPGNVVIMPFEEREVLVIGLNLSGYERRGEELLLSDISICFLTDVYDLNVTFRLYDGKIMTVLHDSPSEDYLDFGSLGMMVSRESSFKLLNPNPVNVSIQKISTDCLVCSLDCSLSPLPQGETASIIPPGESLNLCLRVLTPESEGSVSSIVLITTTFETIKIPVKYQVVRGSLSTVPSDLEFPPVFPGEVTELKLTVYSSFAQEMITKDVMTVPRDDSFSFEHGVLRGRNVIMSVEKSYIGRVIFDPAKGCRKTQSCYVGFDLESKLGTFWLSALNATTKSEINEVTEVIVKILRQRYLTSLLPGGKEEPHSPSPLTSKHLPPLTSNVTLSLNTNQIRGFLFRAKTRLIWPSLLQRESLAFPHTQIGNTSLDNSVILRNPSSLYPLATHLVLPPDSPFSIVSLEPLIEENPSSHQIQGLLALSSNDALSNSKAFTLPPSTSVRLKLQFRPSQKKTSVLLEDSLLIRNNLTGGERLFLSGEGSFPSFILDYWVSDANKLEPISGELFFHLDEGTLKGCFSQVFKVITLRITFWASNMGSVPIWVNGYSIGEYPCEGYGFKIMNCSPFRLAPKMKRAVEIAFTPDYTMSQITQTLHVSTSLDALRPLNYTLVVSIPPHLIKQCLAWLPRPAWEPWIYYTLNIGLLLVFFGVLLAAKLESRSILSFYEKAPPKVFEEECEEVEQAVEEEEESREDESAGLRHRRLHHRRMSSSDNKPEEDENSHYKGHFSTLLELIPRCKKEARSLSSTSGQHTKNAHSIPSSSKPASKKRGSKTPKSSKKPAALLDEAESSSTTTECSNVEDLAEVFNSSKSFTPPHSSSSKTDLKKAKNALKKKQQNKQPNVSLDSEMSPSLQQTSEFSQPFNNNNKKSRPIKNPEDKKPGPKSNASSSSAQEDIPKNKASKPCKIVSKVPSPCEANNTLKMPYDKPPRMLLLPKSPESSKTSSPEDKPLKKAPPPVGKILPEIKSSSGSQYGPIGAPRRSEPSPKHSPQSSDSHIPSNQQISDNGAGTLGNEAFGSSSLMQSLQAERRQMTEEFLLKNRRPVDWPGFDNANPNLLESLWDRPEEVNDGWAGHRGGFGGTSGGIWSNNFWAGPTQHPGVYYNSNNGGGPAAGSPGPLIPPAQQQSQQIREQLSYPPPPPSTQSGAGESFDAQNRRAYYHLSSIWAGNQEQIQQQQQQQNREQEDKKPSDPNTSSTPASPTTWSSTLFHTNQI